MCVSTLPFPSPFPYTITHLDFRICASFKVIDDTRHAQHLLGVASCRSKLFFLLLFLLFSLFFGHNGRALDALALLEELQKPSCNKPYGKKSE